MCGFESTICPTDRPTDRPTHTDRPTDRPPPSHVPPPSHRPPAHTPQRVRASAAGECPAVSGVVVEVLVQCVTLSIGVGRRVILPLVSHFCCLSFSWCGTSSVRYVTCVFISPLLPLVSFAVGWWQAQPGRWHVHIARNMQLLCSLYLLCSVKVCSPYCEKRQHSKRHFCA